MGLAREVNRKWRSTNADPIHFIVCCPCVFVCLSASGPPYYHLHHISHSYPILFFVFFLTNRSVILCLYRPPQLFLLFLFSISTTSVPPFLYDLFFHVFLYFCPFELSYTILATPLWPNHHHGLTIFPSPDVFQKFPHSHTITTPCFVCPLVISFILFFIIIISFRHWLAVVSLYIYIYIFSHILSAPSTDISSVLAIFLPLYPFSLSPSFSVSCDIFIISIVIILL